MTPPLSSSSGTWSVARLRALIADDHPDAAEAASLILSAAGFETQIAHDGLDALKRIEVWNPHVCVLDIAMPEMDGLELVGRVRALAGPNPLLIALSGWVCDEDQQAALEAGFDYFMEKPLDPDQLLRVIKSQLLMWPNA